MTLLVVGDSISFGYELSDLPKNSSGFGNTYLDIDGKEKPMYPSKLAFPELLANKLGMPCENLSLVGGSNDRIFRVVVDMVSKQKYDLVICSWTSINRFDFRYNNQDIALSIGSSPYQIPKFPWLKNFIADHYNHKHMTHRFFSNLICLQALLEQKKQPYIFVNGPDLFDFNKDILDEYQHYITQINQLKFPTWGSSLFKWCLANNLPIGTQGHFLEAGHNLVAERLFRKFKEVYV